MWENEVIRKVKSFKKRSQNKCFSTDRPAVLLDPWSSLWHFGLVNGLSNFQTALANKDCKVKK